MSVGRRLVMSREIGKIECSVVVCTYNPDWEKLRLTLKSIIMQKDCIYQIVITDDGSDDNLFTRAVEFFSRHNFTNYKLQSNSKNMGTVYNILQGIRVASGEFVKSISPGDFLHGKYVLREWIDFMREHRECVMSYSDAIYYRMKNNKIVATKEFAHPQCVDVHETISPRQYLISNDVCLGAATMVRRNLWIKYLEKIVGKVVYAEDNSYRIMMYCGERFAYIPKSFVLYEYGTGVSTSGSDVWGERLRKDWQKTDEIMLSCQPSYAVKAARIPEFLQISTQRCRFKRWKRWRKYPYRLYFIVRSKVDPRTTPMNINKKFVYELLLKEE